MGALKSAMMDIGYFVLDQHDLENGITLAEQKYNMSEDDVKMCVLFVEAYDGSWSDYIQDCMSNMPSVH
tara:strand:- start:12990 stop:13196 length:207 start_codon:yes stop_codon:yes gene_type:complete